MAVHFKTEAVFRKQLGMAKKKPPRLPASLLHDGPTGHQWAAGTHGWTCTGCAERHDCRMFLAQGLEWLLGDDVLPPLQREKPCVRNC